MLCSVAKVKRMTGWKTSSIKNVLHSLTKKGVLVHLGNNLYVDSGKIAENIFSIATLARPPSYISFWTACSYYGFTEQQVKTIQLVSPHQYPPLEIGTYPIETIAVLPKRFFGYQKILNFAIAEKERLLVDLLYKPELCGGIGEVKKCLKAMWPEIRQKIVIEYLITFGNKSCFARLGYLLEELQIKNTIKQILLKHLPACFVKLNPARKNAPNYNKRWRININDQ